MVKWKIKEKKPKNPIKQKIPKDTKNLNIIHKVPTDIKNDFELPPPKKSQLPKRNVIIPSRHGILEKEDLFEIQTNFPPPTSDQSVSNSNHKPKSSPVDKKSNRFITSKILTQSSSDNKGQNFVPSQKGVVPKGIRKKSAINKPVPTPKSPEKQKIIPSSKGGSSNKPINVINRPLTNNQKQNSSKTRVKEKKPSTKGMVVRKLKDKNKPLLKEIKVKTPTKKQMIPPPSFTDKIPKTRIRKKKPR
ncbi:MAG: hypothetical protein ACXAC8_05140 [Candidatus Hodarchaeales archaeon]